MIKATELPENIVSATRLSGKACVEKRTLRGIDEIQYLRVSPFTSINRHTHDNQWEVWIRVSEQQAFVCLKGEEHELVNNSASSMVIMAIKGHEDYTYDDLAGVLSDLGFSVQHGDLKFYS